MITPNSANAITTIKGLSDLNPKKLYSHVSSSLFCMAFSSNMIEITGTIAASPANSRNELSMMAVITSIALIRNGFGKIE
jgi:hypothetical protein